MSDYPLRQYLHRVNNHTHEQDSLPSRLKHLVADLFRPEISDPETISDHAPLLGGDLGLDSLDAVDLAICIEEEFGLSLPSGEDLFRPFVCISSLASFIRIQTQTTPARPRRPAGARIFNRGLTAPLPV